jgi:hypothetical protein
MYQTQSLRALSNYELKLSEWWKLNKRIALHAGGKLSGLGAGAYTRPLFGST